jgi:DNA-binding transcriptional LysR family regulator
MQTMRTMIQKAEHVAHVDQITEHPLDIRKLNWDDLRIFLEVAKNASLRTTAKQTRLSVNNVRSRMDRLEASVGASLMRRSVKGVSLTVVGHRLKHMAIAMRAEMEGMDVKRSVPLIRQGELRIGASEALGSGWLTPHLLDLQSQCPSLTISLMCENDLEADRSAELDIGIVWQPPANPDLIVSKLATLHFMPFASRSYIAERGIPTGIHDLLEHRFIEQCAPGVKSGLLDQLVGTDRPPGFLPIRTNSSLALFWAVASGAGIAFMPTYAMSITRKLVPIDLPFQLKFDIFYYYHPEARGSEPIAAAIAWLKRLFDPERYPWFRSDFVHPNSVMRRDQESNIVRLFEPLVGDDPLDLV